MIVDCGIKYRRTLTIWPQDNWRLFVSRNSCLKYLFMFYMRTHFCLYARFRITKLAYIALLSLLLLQINEAKKIAKTFWLCSFPAGTRHISAYSNLFFYSSELSIHSILDTLFHVYDCWVSCFCDIRQNKNIFKKKTVIYEGANRQFPLFLWHFQPWNTVKQLDKNRKNINKQPPSAGENIVTFIGFGSRQNYECAVCLFQFLSYLLSAIWFRWQQNTPPEQSTDNENT